MKKDISLYNRLISLSEEYKGEKGFVRKIESEDRTSGICLMYENRDYAESVLFWGDKTGGWAVLEYSPIHDKYIGLLPTAKEAIDHWWGDEFSILRRYKTNSLSYRLPKLPGIYYAEDKQQFSLQAMDDAVFVNGEYVIFNRDVFEVFMSNIDNIEHEVIEYVVDWQVTQEERADAYWIYDLFEWIEKQEGQSE